MRAGLGRPAAAAALAPARTSAAVPVSSIASGTCRTSSHEAASTSGASTAVGDVWARGSSVGLSQGLWVAPRVRGVRASPTAIAAAAVTAARQPAPSPAASPAPPQAPAYGPAQSAPAPWGGGPPSSSAATAVALAAMPPGWDYKYPRYPCSSPCGPDDLYCLRCEALFQNVLGFPRLPPRVHRYLERMDVSLEQVTGTVEALADRFGKELVLVLLRRQPYLLCLDFPTIMARLEAARSMLDLRPSEMHMLLRKNPTLLCIDSGEVRVRFNGLHRVSPLNHDAVKRLVVKCPLILNMSTETVAGRIDTLRQLAYTRARWQENFDLITPSLLAFYLKDNRDLTFRLEYLLATGKGTHDSLKAVFKPANNAFAGQHRSFRAWLKLREARMRMAAARNAARTAMAAPGASSPAPGPGAAWSGAPRAPGVGADAPAAAAARSSGPGVMRGGAGPRPQQREQQQAGEGIQQRRAGYGRGRQDVPPSRG